MRDCETRRARCLRRWLATVSVSGVVLAAGATAAPACQQALYDQAGQYASCEYRRFGDLFGGASSDYVQRRLAICRSSYARAWVAIASGAKPLCNGPRFVDTGAGTFVDGLTGLEWEIKADDGGLHDVDDRYTWSDAFTEADGMVFTAFLAALNGGTCFAGHCDWRLPSRQELQTIQSEGYPCTTAPCVDPGVPGRTAPAFHWTSTTNSTGDAFVWGVQFATGVIGVYPKVFEAAVRVVRGGR